MAQASWQFSAFDPNTGETIDFLETPADAQYTRRLDDYCDLRCTLTNPDDFYSVAPFSTGVQALRNGIPRFRGRVVEPFERMPRQRALIAKDPFHNLYWRRVRDHVKYTDNPDEIAWELIALQNSYRDLGLRSGVDRAWGADVTRKYKAGAIVSDEVKALTLTNGSTYHFKINAFLDDADPMAMAKIATFNRGYTKHGARFEFGQNTLENVDDYHCEYDQVINRVTVIGEVAVPRQNVGGPEYSLDAQGRPILNVAQTAKSSPTKSTSAEYDAADSEYKYGIWEEEYGQLTKATSYEHLANVAQAKLVPTPPRVLTVTPNASAPAIFDDYDVGDTVLVRIYDYEFTLVCWAVVWEVVVDIDPDSGQEIISTISFINLEDTSA